MGHLRSAVFLYLGLSLTLMFAGCGGECDGATAASDRCGPPVYGYAQVQGHAWYADSAPVAGKDATVGCGDVVGAYSGQTDRQGGFEMTLLYAVLDTVLYPFPTREADGSFSLDCTATVAVSAQLVLRRQPVSVRFAPTLAGVVPTKVELREDAP
jgi:hypothetical protein